MEGTGLMSFFKKIAASPDEGPGQTKDCQLCDGTGKWVVPAVETAPAKKVDCPQCGGTGKRHK